jgi:hypothetical protein
MALTAILPSRIVRDGRVVLAVLIACALWPGIGWADVSPGIDSALEWNAGSACPDKAAAESAIQDLVGSRIAATDSSDIVQVDLSEQADGRWEARIRTRGIAGSGERRFVGPTCDLVANAAVLVVAMTLEPTATADRVTAMRAPRPPSDALPVLGPREQHLRMIAGLRAMADLGSLPGAASGLGVVLGVHYGRWHFEGEGTAWSPRLALAEPAEQEGGEIGLYTGGLRGCWDGLRSASGELRLGGCLDGEAGVTTGKGTVGIAERHETSGLWVAVFAGLTARQVTASGLTPWLSFDVGTAVRRPSFVVNPGSRLGPPVLVFQASEVVARAALGLAWLFP